MRQAYVGLLLALVGCDPTQGLSDTADAALPDQKRYFDGAGTQLVDGPWNRVVVDLDVDTLYHVGARREDDPEPTFHLFGTDTRDGCSVKPNSGTWLMNKPRLAPYRVLPYLEETGPDGRGNLRFTSLDCEVEDLRLENAGRPYPRVFDRSFLVPVNSGYTLVDPWAGETRQIAGVLQRALVWDAAILLWADDRLKSFSDQLEPAYEWGRGVRTVVGVGDVFFVEDDDGLHRVSFDRDSLEISATEVLEGACHLQYSPLAAVSDPGLWLVLERPCGNPRPSAAKVDIDSGELLEAHELPIETDARWMRALLGNPSKADLPSINLVYLTEVEDDGRGALWAYRMGDELPLRIGDRGDLDSLHLQLGSSEWDGAANVGFREIGDLEGHDWIRFRWDGSVETFAEGVVRNRSTGEMLINYDGVAGDIPRIRLGNVELWLERVPPNQGEGTSYTGERHYARVDEYDGATGRLLLGTDLDDPSRWKDLDSGVEPGSLRFSWFMPALLYLDDWSEQSRTGTLVAYNYELDARAELAKGVSSFDLTRYPWDGVLYSVPNGKRQGIWFSKAK